MAAGKAVTALPQQRMCTEKLNKETINQQQPGYSSEPKRDAYMRSEFRPLPWFIQGCVFQSLKKSSLAPNPGAFFPVTPY